MLIKPVSFQKLIDEMSADNLESRFVARVFFVNNINTYYQLIALLADWSDIIIDISDDMFCKGEDTVPDLKVLIDYLNAHKDSNILLPHLGEYLRVGEATERNSACLYSLLNRHVHSKKRIWIPIFSAKGLFHSIVGKLDEERFGDALFEIDEAPTVFSALAYSKTFASFPGIVNVNGLKSWLRLWDEKKIKSGMSFATRHIKLLSQSSGDYELTIVADPFTYIRNSLGEDSKKLVKELGAVEQWTALVPQVSAAKGKIENLILLGLNIVKFDPYQILATWNALDSSKKWLFYLWYNLGLNQKSDYISYALSKAQSATAIPISLECAILSCSENANFEEWLIQRKEALDVLGITELSQEFWMKYDEQSNTRLKIKILTGRTHNERTKIIELISQSLSSGNSPNDFKSILREKYPDLALYLSEPEYLDHDLSDYIAQYKVNKIADRFNLSFSTKAGEINLYNYKTRGQILFSLKGSCDAYFLWIDGMSIEWIDMLLSKVKKKNSALVNPSVDIGTAVLPTVTSINMAKADPSTISEKKFDELDTLSHIKDKNDCNYHSIIAKQFEVMDRIADFICQAALKHPDKDIIVTADHGMSRLAARSFHKTDGVNAPSSAIVYNHGRYCVMPSDNKIPSITNTLKEENVIAYKTYNHFTSPGNAPGELHGGASPEEMLVPIIHFKRLGQKAEKTRADATYDLVSPDVFLDSNGNAELFITTKGLVKNITVEINTKQLQAHATGDGNWNVLISGLILDQRYSVRIFLNNIFTTKTETICVKRKGLVVDDDF